MVDQIWMNVFSNKQNNNQIWFHLLSTLNSIIIYPRSHSWVHQSNIIVHQLLVSKKIVFTYELIWLIRTTVQAMYKQLWLEPYAVHTTFQYAGTEGKRHRLREAMHFFDPPSYYDTPGLSLSLSLYRRRVCLGILIFNMLVWIDRRLYVI